MKAELLLNGTMSDPQFDILWWKTKIADGAGARAAGAIEAGQLSDGLIVRELEAHAAELLGVPHVVATPNGSMALIMAMLALGVGPGDEVIVPDYTWIASAHAASLVGANIVLVDVEAERPVIDIRDVERKISKRTKAIVPVHLCGRANDVAALREIASGVGAFVVEDACQAIMARAPDGRYLGTLGDIGCYSLGVAKLLPAGQGGLAVTHDADIYERMRAVKTHGVVQNDQDWETYTGRGLNFKMSDILASLALWPLKEPQPHIDHVCRIYHRYREGLANLPGLRVSEIDVDKGEVPLWTEIESQNLIDIRSFLAANKVQTRRVHPPLSRATHLGDATCHPNSERFCSEILVLPSGPAQSLSDVDRVIGLVREWALQNVQRTNLEFQASGK